MFGIFSQVRFETSASSDRELPPPDVPEVIFAGRSNAGKSSVINALTNQKSLARVSKTPGRTQLINFFDMNGQARLVDLPGYGYAKVSKNIYRDWGRLIEQYVNHRECLKGIVLIVDIRRSLMPFDRSMLDWSLSLNLPCLVLLNKADKLSRGAAGSELIRVRQVLPPNARALLFSATRKTGVDEARREIEGLLMY